MLSQNRILADPQKHWGRPRVHVVWEDHLEQVEAGRTTHPRRDRHASVGRNELTQNTPPPPRLTQSVGDARLHVVGADVADPVLVLRLGQHHDADVPESVDGDLEEGDSAVTLGQDTLLDPRARVSHPALSLRCGAACRSSLYFRGPLRILHR